MNNDKVKSMWLSFYMKLMGVLDKYDATEEPKRFFLFLAVVWPLSLCLVLPGGPAMTALGLFGLLAVSAARTSHLLYWKKKPSRM